MKNSTDNSDLPYSVIHSATGIGGLGIEAKAMSLFTVMIRMNSTSFAENCFLSISNTKLMPSEREAVRGNSRKTNITGTISFIIDSREGWSQVITAPDEEFNLFNLATAIAVINASCGCDESRPIVVMINGAEVRVWPRFDGQHWTAENRGDANCEGLS